MGFDNFRKVGGRIASKFSAAGSQIRNIGRFAYGLTPAGVAKSNTDRTIAAQKELSEYQYSKDLEMWQRANEYGSPAAQMQRLKEAGLNPNMVYGSGSAAGASPASLPKYQAPNVQYAYKQPIDLGSIIGLYQDVAMKGAQIENVKAQTRSTDAGVGIGPYFKAMAVKENAQLLGHRNAMEYSRRYGDRGFDQYSSDYGRQLHKQDVERSESMMADNLFKRYRNQWMAAGVTSADHPILRMLVRSFVPGQDGLSLRRTSK